MNSMDGVNQTPRIPSDVRPDAVRPADKKQLAKTAEAFVEVENRLAAQRQKPEATAQFNSIFDELRGRLPGKQ